MGRQAGNALLRIVIGSLAMLVVARPAFPAESEHEPPLAALMGKLQIYLHKLDLSVQGGNSELAAFYQHELEEVAEEIVDDIPEYDGFAISELTRQMMLPGIEALEEALKSGGDPDKPLDQLIETCNACHVATDHAFIEIKRASGNPFNQDFDD